MGARNWGQGRRLAVRQPPGHVGGGGGVVARRMLAANSGKLLGSKNDTSLMGSELQKVELSAREIFQMMVPTDRAPSSAQPRGRGSAALARLGLYPVVTLQKHLLNMIGNLV